MKVGIISDIHIDINKDYDIYSLLTEVAKNKKIDILIIAGDISENCNTTIDFVTRLNSESHIKCYFVPGNHDLWDVGGHYENGDTNEVYKLYCESEYCLCGKVINITEKWILLGNVGWYDYTFGSDKYLYEEFEKMSLSQRTWQDHVRAHWSKSNKEIQKEMYAEIEQNLIKYENKNKILVTHMITNKYFTVPKLGDWEYFNAFLGSEEYTTLCNQYQVDVSIMGHVHYRKTYKESKTEYICSCLNYYNEWKSDQVYKEIEQALYVKEL